MQPNRRAFLKDVGRGMIVASVGPALAADLSPERPRAEAPERLSFGKLDPLVALMQETGPDKLQPLLVERLRNGADLTPTHRRRRPGQRPRLRRRGLHRLPHHDGPRPGLPHGPALPEDRRRLPVFKVLVPQRRLSSGPRRRQRGRYAPARQAGRLAGRQVRRRRCSARPSNTRTWPAPTRPSPPSSAPASRSTPSTNFCPPSRRNWRSTASSCRTAPGPCPASSAWNTPRCCCASRCITASRTRSEAAATRSGRARRPRRAAETARPVQTHGQGRRHEEGGGRLGGPDEPDHLLSTPEQAADAVAAALAEGIAHEAIGEALSLAANQLVLRDNGRPKANNPHKPVGSVHGDGIGVHACDSANAWRTWPAIPAPPTPSPV